MTYLPVKHIFDPITGECLGTIPEDDDATGPMLIRKRAARRDYPVELVPRPRQSSARDQALVDEANKALAMPFEMALAMGGRAEQAMRQQATRIIGAPRTVIDVPARELLGPGAKPVPEGLSPGAGILRYLRSLAGPV